MKKVNAQWLEEKADSTNISSFESLFGFNAVGFIPAKQTSRYMLITSGSAVGMAVNTTGTWAGRESQKISQGQYFIFDSATELYEWMKNKY